ncbi:uncharacterized protein Z518_09986 [Rhinocladiella mackenziei CBS 650.93]|uniref:Fungal-type protein kinase domain-containing protein n=1 Tax=Rhinocladiella mackenziei CBS 650.93 TaxID=1442369 RepID=A0A0D2ICE0_9EURO|nr:uncharacterized protein Z518_09986 [Rhinocladiella mackenziei CBS 650.93]KIX00921.1 hypothetical protein Z518_09986 [Rhinocladiella mackenziei CBS 650.93]
MKNAWEEKVENPSPPPEEEVLRILVEANVRGLPQLHESCRSTAEGSNNVKASSDEMEVLTGKLPPNCENALAAVTNRAIKVIEPSFVSSCTSKSNPPGVFVGIAGEEILRQAQAQGEDFNECIGVRRRYIRLVVSYCQPLKEAMRNAHPKELMRTVCDAMIVYYDAYKRPEHGFLHGDISIENIMVPVKETQLTGGLTHKTLRGTLIDWNLCFTTDGRASSRNIRSGTFAFMAPCLLDESVARRTLGHDMESFFAVMLWVASPDYDDEIAFQNKPLVELMTDNKSSTKAIANCKLYWFENPEAFDKLIIDHFEEPYREDDDFIDCIWDLQTILYERTYDKNALRHSGKGPTNPQKNNDDDDDPMKERLFKDCIAVFDKHLGDEGKQSGSYQLDKIDAGEDPEKSEDESDDTSLDD